MLRLPTINRRSWLALWAQDRRRARQHHLLPAPVLRAVYPDLLQWTWAGANPYRWNVWQSLDGGLSYTLVVDYWTAGSARQFAPDGGSELHLVVGVDADGNEITGRSNAVRPDDALPTLLTGLVAHWGLEETIGDRVDDVAGLTLQTIGSSNIGGSPWTVIGHGAAFDGSGSYLQSTGPTTAFSPTATGFAFSCWVNFDYSNNPWATMVIASVWDDSNYPTGSIWNLYGSAGGESLTFEKSASFFESCGDALVFSDWVHLCVVQDVTAGKWIVYVNGSYFNEITSNDYEAKPGYLTLGNHTNGVVDAPDFFMDEVAVWSRTLSAAEVGQLYNGGAGLDFADY